MEPPGSRAGIAAVRRLLVPVVLLGAVLGVGLVLYEDLGRGSRAAGPPAVLFSAPPGFAMEESGELTRPAAASRAAAALAARPAEPRLGLHFTSDGFELYWLADRSRPGEPALIELAAGPTGTRVESRFAGALAERLAWAAERGRLDPPGAPAAESRNHYH